MASLPTSAGCGDASKGQATSVHFGAVWGPSWSFDVPEHKLGRTVQPYTQYVPNAAARQGVVRVLPGEIIC